MFAAPPTETSWILRTIWESVVTSGSVECLLLGSLELPEDKEAQPAVNRTPSHASYVDALSGAVFRPNIGVTLDGSLGTCRAD